MTPPKQGKIDPLAFRKYLLRNGYKLAEEMKRRGLIAMPQPPTPPPCNENTTKNER